MTESAARIVVGIDGSDSSSDALRWALAEARFRAAEVEAVHAWEYPAFTMSTFGDVAVPVVDKDATEKAAEDLARRVVDRVVGEEGSGAEANAASPVPVSIVTRMGRPSEVLLAEAKGAAMVVVGARGRGGFASLLLGSVSTQVVHHAPVPVVVTPPAAPAD